MEKTRLSSTGHIIIPQPIRTAHHWRAGLELAVIDTAQGILLKPIKPYKSTPVQNIIGCTGYTGPKKSLKEMQLRSLTTAPLAFPKTRLILLGLL